MDRQWRGQEQENLTEKRGRMGLEREYVAAETKGHLRSYMET